MVDKTRQIKSRYARRTCKYFKDARGTPNHNLITNSCVDLVLYCLELSKQLDLNSVFQEVATDKKSEQDRLGFQTVHRI